MAIVVKYTNLAINSFLLIKKNRYFAVRAIWTLISLQNLTS